MNKIVADHSDRDIHVVLDNLNTHKPKRDSWLPRHPNVRFHFTPTHASWMNQVEIWFSILSRSALQGASFTSPQQVRELSRERLKAALSTAEGLLLQPRGEGELIELSDDEAVAAAVMLPMV